MLSSTIARATPRMYLSVPPARAPRHRAHPAWAATIAAARSSRAGGRRRPWLARLRRALREDRFVLRYQPIVSLADGSVSHYEALLRLADGPDGALVAPARFLPAAERHGLIGQIDRMVLDKVLALLSTHSGTPDPALGAASIAINLSALSVSDPSMLEVIERSLAHHGVEPARLMIEVTETASISHMPRARAFCAGMRALGCAVALDDFGAGFGAFQYLKHLPFQYLKIDGSFIRGLPRSPHDQLVVKALAGLARSLGSHTIAECVEDAATLRLLGRLGVEHAQGFHVGAPRVLAGA